MQNEVRALRDRPGEDQTPRDSHRAQGTRQGLPRGSVSRLPVLIRAETQTVSEIIQTHNYKVIYLTIDISQGDGGQSTNLRADNFFLICFGSFCIPSEHVMPPALQEATRTPRSKDLMIRLLYQGAGERDDKTHSPPLTEELQGLLSDARGCYQNS